jgi:OmpA-OmpF porin, OOP family
LAEGNTFCTKCGAAREASTESAAPAAKSMGIPKVAIAVVGVIVLLLVGVAVGVTYVVHRVRQKAQEMEAERKFEKSLAKLASTGNAAAQKGTPSLGQINKSINDLANAANAFTQNAQKQGGPNPLNGIAGIAGSASSNSQASPSRAAIAAALIARESATADAALVPPAVPSSPPMAPGAATGNRAHDWALEYERTVGGPEADLVVRTGDINNLGFGWPPGFDPFSGQSTPPHPYPDIDHVSSNAPPGTDRIMLGTGVMPVQMAIQHFAGQSDRIAVESIVTPAAGDGYSGSLVDCFYARNSAHGPFDRAVYAQAPRVIQLPAPGYIDNVLAAKCVRERALTMPTPIVLPVGALPGKIKDVVIQIFADDFQVPVWHSHFQVGLNGTRIPTFEYAINALNQTGPIGKLVTMRLLPEYWPLLRSGEVKLLIDDPTTHEPDGYAVDFVRILVNPHKFKYQVSLTATVTDADTHKPIAGATVNAGLPSAATDRQGKCALNGIPAGLVVATANAPGYDENSVPVDLPAGQSGNADIQLHHHQESTAALEQSIAQSGTATIYGIHFDTGSSKLRADSTPALEAVLGLINGRPESNWVIAGHTDNQGSDKINIPLSKGRAASVVSWLTAHGVAANRLEPQGFGSTRPVADNGTASGRALNRRVEVSLAK